MPCLGIAQREKHLNPKHLHQLLEFEYSQEQAQQQRRHHQLQQMLRSVLRSCMNIALNIHGYRRRYQLDLEKQVEIHIKIDYYRINLYEFNKKQVLNFLQY